jgi:predicted dehydrogenase/threonine dehydrogenase-like Zn-dependent dehydrogenase
MKQVSQRLRDGQLRVLDVPAPQLDDWKVLVRTHASLVSAGTERAKVEVARQNLLGKARRRPDQVRQVVERVRSDGLKPTIDAVRNRLEALSPLGYCAAGRVEEVGARVSGIGPGELVACGGEEAAHAEVLAVPGNLCCPVPEGVDVVSASFTTLGAIALQGFRQADVRLGERVAVVGLGLVGQLTARIARAAGCEVMGIDLEEWRVEAARQAGALDVARRRGDVGAADHDSWDAVLVTAAAPNSNDPVSLAVELARDRGTIVVVGDVGLELDRRPLYAKELELRLARSYGPGRYDVEYEQRGLDYPLPYVRWTERRNMSEFLRLLADGSVAVADLVTHRFPIEHAEGAFAVLTDGEQRAQAVVIDYSAPQERVAAALPREPQAVRHFAAGAHAGFVGAGSFACRHLIPLAKREGLVLDLIASGSGLSAVSAAERFGFERGAVETAEVLNDEAVSGVFVATRHDLHGRLALEALRAGKAVFVEKPLCLEETELAEIASELEREGSPPLMVGFNRRFAPLTQRLREHLAAASGPTNVLVRVNAGSLPADHWLNDPHIGGGRLLGEGCHFFDLICALAGSEPVSVSTQGRISGDRPVAACEDFAAVIRFADGSLGTLLYGTAGAGSAGKEVVEAHRGTHSGRIDDFNSAVLWGNGRPRKERSRGRDKGHGEEIRRFAAAMRGEEAPPPFQEALVSSRLTLAALRSLETGSEEAVNAQAAPAQRRSER